MSYYVILSSKTYFIKISSIRGGRVAAISIFVLLTCRIAVLYSTLKNSVEYSMFKKVYAGFCTLYGGFCVFDKITIL